MIAVTILGSNSAVPAHGRHPTAQIVQTADHMFLVDCGEGTQMQMNAFKIRKSRINHIFISHLHGDHYFGLIGLINTFGLNHRNSPLYIFSPPGIEDVIRVQLDITGNVLPYDLIFQPLKEGVVFEDNRNLVEAFPVNHRIECYGFVFREKKFPRKINAEAVRKFKVPVAAYAGLHRGEDYVPGNGKTIANKILTEAAALPKSYAYCADTAYFEAICGKIKNVNMVYHESTYRQDQQQKAADRFHSTTADAARIAVQSDAGRLILGHFSAVYDDLEPLKEEACHIFANSEIATEGVCYIV